MFQTLICKWQIMSLSPIGNELFTAHSISIVLRTAIYQSKIEFACAQLIFRIYLYKQKHVSMHVCMYACMHSCIMTEWLARGMVHRRFRVRGFETPPHFSSTCIYLYNVFQKQGTPFLSFLVDATWHPALSRLDLLFLVWPKINRYHTCLWLLAKPQIRPGKRRQSKAAPRQEDALWFWKVIYILYIYVETYQCNQ